MGALESAADAMMTIVVVAVVAGMATEMVVHAGVATEVHPASPFAPRWSCRASPDGHSMIHALPFDSRILTL